MLLRSLRAFYFFFAAAAVRRRLVALERDGAALALKLSGAERVRSIEELRQVLDRVTVGVVNGLLDAEFLIVSDSSMKISSFVTLKNTPFALLCLYLSMHFLQKNGQNVPCGRFGCRL